MVEDRWCGAKKKMKTGGPESRIKDFTFVTHFSVLISETLSLTKIGGPDRVPSPCAHMGEMPLFMVL